MSTARVFGHALVFGLAPVLQRLVGVILLPLYTHYLSPGDYGTVELLGMASGLFGVVLRLELRNGYMRAWIAAPDEAARARLFSTAVRMLGVLGVAGSLAFLLASSWLAELLLDQPISLGFRLILAFGVLLDVLGLVFNATLQAQLRSATMVALGVAQFALGASLSVLCIVVLRLGPIGLFIGGTTAACLGVVAMALVQPRALWRARFDRAILRQQVAYAWPLLIGALLFVIVRNTDRLAVGKLISLESLGVYAMAWTLANLLHSMVATPIQVSLEVWRLKLHARDDAAGFAKVFRVALVLIAAAGVGLATFGADAFRLAADPRYEAAPAYLPGLCLAVLLQAGYSIVASAFFVSGATGTWSRILSAGAFAQVALCVTLVPLLGLAGAVIGICGANLMLYVGAAIWGRRHWAVPYSHRALGQLCLLLLVCPQLRLAVPASGLGAVALDTAALGLFLACLLPLGLLLPADLRAVAELLRLPRALAWVRGR